MTDNIHDIAQQAAALSEMARQGLDINETALTIGQSARAYGDGYRFILGEIANTLTSVYGESTMADWAKAAKVGSVSTARHYARVTAALGLSECLRYLSLDLSYTFIRTVVFKTPDDASAAAYLKAFTETPIGDTPPALPKSLKPRAKTLLDIQDAVICDVNAAGGFIVVQVGNGGLNLLDSIGKPVHLIIKEKQQ